MEKITLLIGEDAKFSHAHNTRWTSDMLQSGSVLSRDLTKYDSILKNLELTHPDIFYWLLRYFRLDMRMFGYTWNSNTGTSGCEYVENKRVC